VPPINQAISDCRGRLNRAGLVVILELHWSAAGTAIALGQAPMPNRDHTPRSGAKWPLPTAATCRDLRPVSRAVPDNNANTAEAWRCMRDGGTCADELQAAGCRSWWISPQRGRHERLMVGGVQ